jgi:hypothetical protein
VITTTQFDITILKDLPTHDRFQKIVQNATFSPATDGNMHHQCVGRFHYAVFGQLKTTISLQIYFT